MAIDLRTFASGDTDYIAKLNANSEAIKQAIDNLQMQAGAAGAGSALSAGMFIATLFNFADALIGPQSYKPTQSASTLTVQPGGMYLSDAQMIVTSFNNVNLSFVGQTAGTHYLVIDSSGIPTRRDTQQPGTVYSVSWTGSAFSGSPVRIAPAFYDTIEADASRKSTVLGTNYASLDARLEAGEQFAKDAKNIAEDAMDEVEDIQVIISQALAPIRKVGVTVDGIAGIKGAIQLDFAGLIIGWSVIADQPCDLQVEVDRKASAAPPAAPAIPSTTTDKISASAPITLAGAQSAAVGTTGVSSWAKDLKQWDVVQFNVIQANTLTRATLYLRIRETWITAQLTSANIPSASVANAPLAITQA